MALFFFKSGRNGCFAKPVVRKNTQKPSLFNWAKLQSAKNTGKSTVEPHCSCSMQKVARKSSPCCKNDEIFNASFWSIS